MKKEEMRNEKKEKDAFGKLKSELKLTKETNRYLAIENRALNANAINLSAEIKRKSRAIEIMRERILRYQEMFMANYTKASAIDSQQTQRTLFEMSNAELENIAFNPKATDDHSKAALHVLNSRISNCEPLI